METTADRSAMMRDFGRAITLSDATTITALIDVTHEYTREAVLSDWWLTLTEEDSGGILIGDSVTIDGVSYTVLALLPDGTGIVRVRLDPP